MKSSWLGLSLLSLLAAPALGAPSDASSDLESEDHASLVTRSNRGLDAEEPSIFNEVEVPPLTQITPENFEEVTKDGIW
jgi:protein disulfide-isomerase